MRVALVADNVTTERANKQALIVFNVLDVADAADTAGAVVTGNRCVSTTGERVRTDGAFGTGLYTR